MKFAKTILTSLLVAAAALSAAAQAPQKPEVRCAENRVIYELFVRNFSYNSKFKSVEAQVPRLRDLGIDVIWLMPVQKLGDIGKWGTYSSPYAVKNYYEVDPLYGNKEDFRDLVNAIHAAGMEVWLDWVANHTSMDAEWVYSHPEYYVNYQNGFYHPNGWNDVYELNYDNREMRQAMIAAMKYWIDEFGIDGFRLDNTDGVPNDFWSEARYAIDSAYDKEIGWLAETNSDNIMSVFDCNYAWTYADYLRSIGSGSNASGIAGKSMEFYTNPRYSNKTRMVYLTNHDVVQDVGGTEDKWFGDNLKPMTVLEFTIYGMPLIFNGQEIKYSNHNKIMLSERTVINWNSGDPSMTQLITDLCHLKHTEPALRTGFQAGELRNLSATNSSVYAFERRRGSYSTVVMLNFSGSQATFTVSGLPSNTYTDYFTGTVKNFAANPTFTLPARGYAVWIKDDSGVEPDPEPTPDTYCNITFVRPANWTNTPHIHIYYDKDKWGTSADVTFLDNTAMHPADIGIDGAFTYRVKNLSDRFNVMFNNGGWSGGQSDSRYEELAGDYVYTLDGSQVVYYVGGIDGIEADSADAPREYYDLTGRRIDRPAAGIYIVKQGAKVWKEQRY